MVFVKIALSTLILFFFGLNSFAQDSGLKTINTEDLKRHLTFISSDSLQGRAFGTPIPGLEITANYLKTNIKEMGLAAGDDGYFQTVPIVLSQPDNKNSFLEITDNNGKAIFKTDSVIGLPAGRDINISNAEVVFAGFGTSDEKTGYDDFKGLDLQGKVVIFSLGSPEGFKNKELPGWNNKLETTKVNRAMKLGAAGVILTDSPLAGGNSIYKRVNHYRNRGSYSLQTPEKEKQFNDFVLTTSLQADAVLGKKGKLKKLLSKISKENKPRSFAIEGIRANVNIKGETEHFQAKNVVGIVEGSHPFLLHIMII